MLHNLNCTHDILGDIEDPRCCSVAGTIDNVFLTPNFLQNFDFMGGYDKVVLDCKVGYASL